LTDPRAVEVEQLVQANAASNATLRNLVEKVQLDAGNRERKIELLETESKQIRKLLALVGLAVVLLLGLAVVNLIGISQARESAATSAAAARDAQSTNNLLYGCFEPNSQCAQQNKKTQTQILDEIKVYTLSAIYCSRENPSAQDATNNAFLSCLKRIYPNGPTLKGR
jgi:hypothetical protein